MIFLASAIKENSEIVKHGVTGRVFAVKDPDDLARKLIEVEERKTETALMVNNAYRMVVDAYNIDIVSATFQQFIQKVLRS